MPTIHDAAWEINNTFTGTNTFLGNVSVIAPITLANTTIGTASTLAVNTIKQQAGAAFVLADPLGVAHAFIASSSPYTNTFINGNGSGVVFLGSAAKTSVADTTGNIVTAGSITLQNTSQLLPATFANDTLGGFLLTTNAGKGWQIANTGQLQGFAGVGILLQGATSGGINFVVPAVAGSNTNTFQAANDTFVYRATTDTLTNKTLTSPAISNPTITGDTAVKRIKANQGTALVTGDVSAITNFGTTATCSAVTGNDMAGSITISSSGTGQVANGTFLLTFHDGTWTTAPTVLVSRGDGNGPNTAPAFIASVSATSVLFGFAGTAVAGTSYTFYFHCIGR